MYNKELDKESFKRIVQFSYEEFRKKEAVGKTRTAVIEQIIKIIESEVKRNDNKQN